MPSGNKPLPGSFTRTQRVKSTTGLIALGDCMGATKVDFQLQVGQEMIGKLPNFCLFFCMAWMTSILGRQHIFIGQISSQYRDCWWPGDVRIHLGYQSAWYGTYGLHISVDYMGRVNSLCAKFFRENIHVYLHFMSLLHIDMTQVLKILPHVRPVPIYRTQSISLLLMSWRRKEPWHQQQRYWPS